jgi:branched-chain amino acid transport system substrate-binding protein
VVFQPYSTGFTDASPLVNKVKASGANALFSVYLNDLILIVHARLNRSASRLTAAPAVCHSRLLQECKQARRRFAGCGALERRHERRNQKVNAEYKKRTGEFLFECRRPCRSDFMLADAPGGRARPSTKVREALSRRRFEGLRSDGAGRKSKVLTARTSTAVGRGAMQNGDLAACSRDACSTVKSIDPFSR